MTSTREVRPTKIDPIASHRYVLPIVREVSSVSPASSALETNRRAAAAKRRSHTDPTDLEHVVAAAASGDRTAMSKLVKRFSPRVRAVARSHRLATYDIEDVMQTTWLRLLQHAHRIHDPNVLGAWLETTARRECQRVLKANGRERPTDNELLLDESTPALDEQPLATFRGRATLAVALTQLPRHERELLAMLFADPIPCYAEVSREIAMRAH